MLESCNKCNAAAKGDGGGASGCSQQDMELSKVSCPGTCVCRADAVRDTQTVKHGIYGIAMHFSGTGKEVEDCFVAFVKCLPLLIRPELDKIHGRAGSSPSQPGSRLNDPTSEVIRVLCAFLRWDGALSAPALDVDQVASVRCESS